MPLINSHHEVRSLLTPLVIFQNLDDYFTRSKEGDEMPTPTIYKDCKRRYYYSTLTCLTKLGGYKMNPNDLDLIREALGEDAAREFALLIANANEPKKIKKPPTYRDRDKMWDGTFKFGVVFPNRKLEEPLPPDHGVQFTNPHPLYKNLCVKFRGREAFFCKCITGECPLKGTELEYTKL